MGSNHIESVNDDNHSTSEILPAEAAAIEVEPTSEHHNAALKLLHFLPFQQCGKDPSYLTSAEPKSSLFCQGWCMIHCPWLTIMIHQILFFFVHEFCVKLPRNSCENEYSLYAVSGSFAPRHCAVGPPPLCLFSIPMPTYTLHCIHNCIYSCKHIRQDSNWVQQ